MVAAFRAASWIAAVSLLSLFTSSSSAPVSLHGLESWMIPSTCLDACESQWWNLEPAEFESAEQCSAVICTPIIAFAEITGRSMTAEPDGNLPLALLEDFINNCDAMCDAEWWFDNTGLESASHCRRAICTRPAKAAAAAASSSNAEEGAGAIKQHEDSSTVRVTATRKLGNATARASAGANAAPGIALPEPAAPAAVTITASNGASTLPVAAAADLSHMVKRKKLSKAAAQPASTPPSSSSQQAQAAAASPPSASQNEKKESESGGSFDAGTLLAASPESLLPKGPCYKHAACTDAGYCAADLKCHSIMACKPGVAENAVRPIDGLCPAVDPEAAAAAAAAAAEAAIPVAIAKIQVYVGHYVDQIRFVLSNGETVKFGPEGGTMQEEYVVPAGEWITWIKVRQGEHLDSIQFYTNRGKSSPFYGGPGGRKAIFHVKRGNEVIGLTRSAGADEVSPPVKGIDEQLHRALIVTETSADCENCMNANSIHVLR